MKISREQKEKNRQALLNAGLELMQSEGFRKTTMKEIAHKANLSEPVVYKYFPTKEHLLWAFFAQTFNNAYQKAQNLKDFAGLSFPEQIQILIDAHLAELTPQKDLAQSSFTQFFFSSISGAVNQMTDLRDAHVAFSKKLLAASQAAQEFKVVPPTEITVELIWHYHLGMIYYWFNDKSPGAVNTLQLLDKSISLLQEILNSQVINKALDLFYFFIREHLIKTVDNLLPLSEAQKEIKTRFLSNEKD